MSELTRRQLLKSAGLTAGAFAIPRRAAAQAKPARCSISAISVVVVLLPFVPVTATTGARRYGNSFAKNAEPTYTPSVYLSAPASASDGLQPFLYRTI